MVVFVIHYARRAMPKTTHTAGHAATHTQTACHEERQHQHEDPEGLLEARLDCLPLGAKNDPAQGREQHVGAKPQPLSATIAALIVHAEVEERRARAPYRCYLTR
jgi:hypothetical protein